MNPQPLGKTGRLASSADLPIGGGKRFPTIGLLQGEWLVSLSYQDPLAHAAPGVC